MKNKHFIHKNKLHYTNIMTTSIGIDLGTTYSCVAVWRDGKIEIIPNDQGNRTTPSYVAFTENERLIGDAAKNQATCNILNTIYDVKRLMGRKYSDPSVQNDIKHLQYNVIDKNDKPMIKINYKGEERILSPEEISAAILSKMKETAEAYLGKEVKNAVITVPAYFNDTQRQATKDAGTIAGLNVLRIINEPTASAIAYGLDKQKDSEKNILVFDFGGGTHDISVLTIDQGMFEVKAVSGDTHLGGEDIDNALTDYFISEINKKYKKDISQNKKAIKRLKNACERAKRTLSSVTHARIEIDTLFDDVDLNMELTRGKFEEICMPIFRRTIIPIDEALHIAKLDKNSIDEVVLVGGSTRIPKIQDMLKEYFNGKELNKSVNPDEAVAYGAAVQASILSGGKDEKTNDVLILDVTPLTIGIETEGQIMTPMVQRGKTIPVKQTQIFSTYADNQTSIRVRIFEGERKLTKDCNKLGEFELSNIPPMPRGEPQIEITYDIDANSILTITAVEKSTGSAEKITIKNDKDRLSKDEIDRMIHDAEKFESDDNRIKNNIEMKNKLETYLYSIKKTMNDNTIKIKEKLSPEKIDKINKTIDDTTKWLDGHQNVEECEYNTIYKNVEDTIQPIMTEFCNQNQGTHEQQPTTSTKKPNIENVD